MRISRCWNNHSLTIASGILSICLWIASYYYSTEPFDLSKFLWDMGFGVISITALGVFSLKFRETAKPED